MRVGRAIWDVSMCHWFVTSGLFFSGENFFFFSYERLNVPRTLNTRPEGIGGTIELASKINAKSNEIFRTGNSKNPLVQFFLPSSFYSFEVEILINFVAKIEARSKIQTGLSNKWPKNLFHVDTLLAPVYSARLKNEIFGPKWGRMKQQRPKKTYFGRFRDTCSFEMPKRSVHFWVLLDDINFSPWKKLTILDIIFERLLWSYIKPTSYLRNKWGRGELMRDTLCKYLPESPSNVVGGHELIQIPILFSRLITFLFFSHKTWYFYTFEIEFYRPATRKVSHSFLKENSITARKLCPGSRWPCQCLPPFHYHSEFSYTNFVPFDRNCGRADFNTEHWRDARGYT